MEFEIAAGANHQLRVVEIDISERSRRDWTRRRGSWNGLGHITKPGTPCSVRDRVGPPRRYGVTAPHPRAPPRQRQICCLQRFGEPSVEN